MSPVKFPNIKFMEVHTVGCALVDADRRTDEHPDAILLEESAVLAIYCRRQQQTYLELHINSRF